MQMAGSNSYLDARALPVLNRFTRDVHVHVHLSCVHLVPCTPYTHIHIHRTICTHMNTRPPVIHMAIYSHTVPHTFYVSAASSMVHDEGSWHRTQDFIFLYNSLCTMLFTTE
jgi:hypothetical protein